MARTASIIKLGRATSRNQREAYRTSRVDASSASKMIMVLLPSVEGSRSTNASGLNESLKSSASMTVRGELSSEPDLLIAMAVSVSADSASRVASTFSSIHFCNLESR